LQAAAAGHGVALARSALVNEDLNNGTLVRPFASEMQAEFAYYLAYPSSIRLRQPAIEFRRWLLMQLSGN
jgi:LysR family glycine cleavage system transcriptional activator